MGRLRWRCGEFPFRCVFRMDWRVGRGAGVCCGGVGGGTWIGYPSRRLAVMRYCCSAGGVGGMGLRSGGASSGCGPVRRGLCGCLVR